MKAAVLEAIPSEYTITDVEIDRPQPNEVLVQTVAAGVCHSDLQFVEGRQHIAVPFVAGHESAGIVEAVGSQVTYVKPGDRVVTYLNSFCGRCKYCLSGRPFACRDSSMQRPAGAPARLRWRGEPIEQFFSVSSFAERLLVHESQVTKVPNEMPLDRAALLGCAAITGLGAVFHTAGARPGDTVVVFGCGGVGLNVVQGAAIAGAERIIAVDPVPAKRELARVLGATDTLGADASVVDEILSLTEGGADHAFDAIGLKTVAEQCVKVVARGGAATIVGMMPEEERLELNYLDLVLGKRVLGCSMGSNRARIDIPFYASLYLQGRLKLDELISRRVQLDDIQSAFNDLRTGAVTRSLIVFPKPGLG